MMGGRPMEGMHGMKCDCSHHKVVPITIIAFGLLFLLGALDVFTAATVAIIWPILVIVAGGVMLMGRKCSCC